MPSQFGKIKVSEAKKQRMTKKHRASVAASVRGIFKGLIMRQEKQGK
jgi:hypothetical protein